MLERPDEGPSEENLIQLRGVRVHNLKGISVDIPRDRLVVLTGVSGSGKSSLAFDTLYAEGQRRYIESLSAFARQFLDQAERPDVDAIDGLPPTVAIDQRAGSANPRSTIGTLTEILDYLRLLYARVGLAHCPTCRTPIRSQTPEQIVGNVMAMPEGRKVLVLAPLVRGRKGKHAEAFQAIRRAGLLRARVDGKVIEVSPEDLPLPASKEHDIEAVIDRLVLREGIRPRLSESVDLALKVGQGAVILSCQVGEVWEDLLFSVHSSCPDCGQGVGDLEPRSFSFNSPHGACPDCGGLGEVPTFDQDLLIPDFTLSLSKGAIAPWSDPRLKGLLPGIDGPRVKSLLKKAGLKPSTPLSAWPDAAVQTFLLGDPGGLIRDLQAILDVTKSQRVRGALEAYRSPKTCGGCGGARLGPGPGGVLLGGRSLPEVSNLAIIDAKQFLEGLEFDPGQTEVGPPLAAEAVKRLGFLARLGVGYLSLSRGSDTLSGGELQRVRLASRIGSGLVGVCYILDEPTAGLHPRDTDRLLEALTSLRDQGNSVIVVEHDESTILASDWLIDLGPGAGPEGGEVVAEGTPEAVKSSGQSLTARYLRGEQEIPHPASPRIGPSTGWLHLRNIRARNLKGIDVDIPSGAFSCVTGVSGSGKSTLVYEVLARVVRRRLDRRGPKPEGLGSVVGEELFDKLILVDQSPIGKGPRSTPATYTGVFDEIRKLFARTKEAKVRGYKPSRFSFNAKGGRCEVCEGQGLRRIPLNFLPDLEVRCEACEGLRFHRQTLEIQFKGRSIGDVLRLRVDESRELFRSQPAVSKGLDSLQEAGLGYLTLGQSGTTLSGGEAQRVKLSVELARPSTGKTLYLLDEPTTGLHFHDVSRLLGLLQRLTDLGNTLVVIEHNLDVVKTADWVIDLGPEGGDLGGQLLAMGPPALLASSPDSATGKYLRKAAPGAT